jgi:predicted permease
LDQARQRLLDVARSRDLASGDVPPDGVRVVSLLEEETAGYRGTTNILAGAVGAILLIACINVAGLLLARGATRKPELGVRASLGASRFRLIRQMLAESLVLAIIGGAAGVVLAWITLDVLVANIPLSLPPNSPPALNLRVLGFSAALAITTGLLFGLAPAWTLSRVDVTGTLARGGHRQGSALSRRAGQLLIAAEITLCIVLLAGSALMIRSFARMLSLDVGFDHESVIVMEASPVDPDEAVAARYYPALVEALRQLPGIHAVGAVDSAPLVGGSRVTGAIVDGTPTPMLHLRSFVPGYFEAIGFSLEQGRLPAPAEARSAVPPALVNESAARQMFGAGSPLGRQFRIGRITYHVVGVVNDVRHYGPLGRVEPEVYIPLGTSAERMHVVLRSSVDLAALAPQLRRIAHEIGPRVIVNHIRPSSEWLYEKVATPRRRTVLLSVLGGLGFLLALVGVFGMTAYAVARRTQEIGIRMALGARASQVVSATVRDSLLPVIVGIAAGLFGAALATRVIAKFLFDTRPIEPTAFAAVAVLVAVAATLAAWIPARRAAKVDPVSALRVTT